MILDPPPSQVAPETIAALIECARSTPPGPFVEVGVFQGGTAWHLAKLAQERGDECWLYDTFTGMPYCGPMDSHKLGDFSSTSYQAVCEAIPYAHVIQGIYPFSAMCSEVGGPSQQIAFAHLDCDQEESYRTAIEYLLPKMCLGGVMWFDDAPALAGAKHAVLEAFDEASLEKTQGKWWVRL